MCKFKSNKDKKINKRTNLNKWKNTKIIAKFFKMSLANSFMLDIPLNRHKKNSINIRRKTLQIILLNKLTYNKEIVVQRILKW